MTELVPYSIHFVVSFIGGTFGTLVGGCSLITVPCLIFLGLPADVAIGSNRFGLTGMSLVGWYKFHQQRMINYKAGILIAIPAAIGSVIGANWMLMTQLEILPKVVAVLSIIVLLVIMVNRQAGLEHVDKKISIWHYGFAIIATFLLGIYGGYYGAAFGTFLSFVLVFVFGETFLESAGTRKITMSLLCIVATTIFILNKAVHYPFAITQFVGMGVGSWVGAHYSEAIGNVWVRRLLILVGFLLAFKLIV